MSISAANMRAFVKLRKRIVTKFCYDHRFLTEDFDDRRTAQFYGVLRYAN